MPILLPSSINRSIGQLIKLNVLYNGTNAQMKVSIFQFSKPNIAKKIVEYRTTKPIETNISTFSTKIYTKDSARQNNINITCNSINDTVIKKQETFSFCDIVGMATTEKGYQKADIFDKDGNKKKGLRWWKLPGK